MTRSSVWVVGSFFPGPDVEGDAGPAPVVDVEPQRDEGLGRGAIGDAVDVEVAVELPAHVAGRVGRPHRAQQPHLRLAQCIQSVPGRRFHRGRRDHLHQVVDHNVTQRPDGIVEMAAIVHAELLGHGDLDTLHVAAIPQRLKHRVGEPQVEDLLVAHLSEVVVDPEQLRLVDVPVQIGGQRARRLQVVPEGLLHDHPGSVRQLGLGQALDHPAEQERRDFQVEHRMLRLRRPRRPPAGRCRSPRSHLAHSRAVRQTGRTPPRPELRPWPRSSPGHAAPTAPGTSRRPATPTIGQSSSPRSSNRYSERNVITLARSPVIPKITRTA